MTHRHLFAIALLGALALACAEDDLDKGGAGDPGLIEGSVSYAGAEIITRVAFSVFDRADYPPVSAPVKAFYSPADAVAAGVTLPMDYVVADLDPGEYWVMAYGDIDPNDGMMPLAIDPASEWMGPIEVGAGASASVDLVLEDGKWQPQEDVVDPAD
jgi:hypothetical protein